MAISQALANSLRQDLFLAIHNLQAVGDVIKIALYTSAATLDATTTVYTASNEVAGPGYVAGGYTLTTVDPVLSGAISFIDFGDATWTSATFTARGALIYNFSKGNKAIGVLDFGSDKSITSGTFTVIFPTADTSNAILRIA